MGYHAPSPSRLPFWSEVITAQGNGFLVSADSYSTVTIQPSSGETWNIFCGGTMACDTANSFVIFRRKTASEMQNMFYFCSAGNYNPKYPTGFISMIITNDVWLEIYVKNDCSSLKNFWYAYSGYKLGTKKVEFENVETIKTIQSERLTKYKIKSEFEGLEDLIRDVYDSEVDDYKQVIYFYKDRPIRKDKRTGHIIERASRYIETDKLIENLEKVKTGELQLEKTGYKSWLERIKKERGIDLLVRL